jgi:hypothetical protein
LLADIPSSLGPRQRPITVRGIHSSPAGLDLLGQRAEADLMKLERAALDHADARSRA